MNARDVLAAVTGYVDGVAAQDAARLRALFHEASQIIGLDEGRPVVVPRDRWIAHVCAAERAGAGGAAHEILGLRIDGSVASAVVRTRFGRFAYRDTLVLLDAPDGLRIVGKTFHQEPAG